MTDAEDTRRCRPVCLAAWGDGRPVGLLVSAAATGHGQDGGEQILLSLMTVPGWRRRGVGKTLLAALETRVSALGIHRLSTSFSDRLPGAPAFLETLRSAGWPEPAATRLRICGEVGHTGAVFRDRASLLNRLKRDGFRLWSWRERGAEAARLVEALAARGEAPPDWAGLGPWREALDPDLSLVMGDAAGEVVGWALCVHQPALSRWFFPVGWVRPPYDRRGWLLGAYVEGAERLGARHGDTALAVIETASGQEGMWRLFERRFAPHVRWSDRLMESTRALDG